MDVMRFPCQYQDLGCPVKVPFVNETDEIGHEEVCEYRQYVCPVLGPARCDWIGTRANILQHCYSEHPDQVLQNPFTFQHDLTQPSSNTYLLTAFQVLFLVFTKVCLVSGQIFYAVRYLGSTEVSTHFKYNLDIKREEICLCKAGDVAPQGCLAMQEPTSLAVNINSLLEFLGGMDDITFTVTVKRRLSGSTKKLPRTGTCVRCKKMESVFVYRHEDGWRCKDCAPTTRACKLQAQGCTFADINVKCAKHESYFCQQSTKCWLCWKAVPRGTLSAHYDSIHADVTYKSGSTWRMTESDSRQRCLLSSVAGTMVCEYWLPNARLQLKLFTSLSNEELGDFHCEVLFTDPATGKSYTFTPEALYSKDYDWRIDAYVSPYLSWSDQLDVCIKITKEDTNFDSNYPKPIQFVIIS